MCSGYLADKKINRINAKKILFVREAGKIATENGQKKTEVGKDFVPEKKRDKTAGRLLQKKSRW